MPISTQTQDRLKQYTLTAGTLTAGVTMAVGQVTYTDVNPDVVLNTDSASYAPDLDNDGTAEFNLMMLQGPLYTSTSYQLTLYGVVVGSTNNASLAGAYRYYNWGGQSASFFGVEALPDQAGIPQPNMEFESYGFLGFLGTYNMVNIDFQEWLGENNKYIGVKFQLPDGVHYGWVRCTMTSDGRTFIIKDYAYADEPDQSIVAGTLLLSAGEQEGAQASILQNESLLKIYMPAATRGELTVVSTAGEQVYDGEVTDQSEVALNQLSDGIYVVRLQFGNEVVTRKIVVFQ